GVGRRSGGSRPSARRARTRGRAWPTASSFASPVMSQPHRPQLRDSMQDSSTAARPRTHGVREFHENSDACDAHAEAIVNIGYTIAEGLLSADELSDARERIDAIYARQRDEIGG